MKPTDLKLYKYLCIEVFFLVSLGGAVRAMNAGLACPDWPLCFGDFIPDYHPQVYFEFIHRVLAGIIGIGATYLNIQVMRSTVATKNTKRLAFFALVLLLAQIIMGGLTVLLRLHEQVVTIHLALGTAFFAISLWIYLSFVFVHDYPGSSASSKGTLPTVIFLLSVYFQIILGALVASHYAAQVCTDFPLCHGQWIPTLSGPIGLHVIHRLGAYVLTVIILGYFVYMWRKVDCPWMKKWARYAFMVLLFQVGLGIANVVNLTPPLLTVLHLATGTFLLGIAVRSLRVATWRAS